MISEKVNQLLVIDYSTHIYCMCFTFLLTTTDPVTLFNKMLLLIQVSIEVICKAGVDAVS